MRNSITKKQIFQIILGAVLVFTALICGVLFASLPDREMRSMVASSSTPSAAKIQIPIDLTGTWVYDSKCNLKFSADVQQGMIMIKMTDTAGTLDYYYGSLQNPMTNGEIISTKDNSRFSWSTAITKQFTYQDESLTFTFGSNGTTKTIELRRGK